jgi:hypothetical protein
MAGQRDHSVMPDRDRLPGGWMSGSRLVDGTVRRRLGPHSPFVHQLLSYLDQRGFDAAPRLLGVENKDEILTYLDGVVPVETDPRSIPEVVFSDSGIRSAFRLIRRYHDLTAGSDLAGGTEVVCHGDLSPWNTVYDDHGAVAFIDWDNAAPGSRASDVGYAAWRYLMLGFENAPTVETQKRQLRVAVAAYGMWDLPELLRQVRSAQRSQREGFERDYAAGDPRIGRLVKLGALDHIESAQRWLDKHESDLLD